MGLQDLELKDDQKTKDASKKRGEKEQLAKGKDKKANAFTFKPKVSEKARTRQVNGVMLSPLSFTVGR